MKIHDAICGANPTKNQKNKKKKMRFSWLGKVFGASQRDSQNKQKTKNTKKKQKKNQKQPEQQKTYTSLKKSITTGNDSTYKKRMLLSSVEAVLVANVLGVEAAKNGLGNDEDTKTDSGENDTGGGLACVRKAK